MGRSKGQNPTVRRIGRGKRQKWWAEWRVRAAEAIFRLETSANDPVSAESVAAIIDAEFAPLLEALKALPIEAFDKPMDDIDAAEFRG